MKRSRARKVRRPTTKTTKPKFIRALEFRGRRVLVRVLTAAEWREISRLSRLFSIGGISVRHYYQQMFRILIRDGVSNRPLFTNAEVDQVPEAEARELIQNAFRFHQAASRS